MILDWLFPSKKIKLAEQTPTWEYSEEPILVDYEAEHREMMEIIDDILNKLDEIKVLIDEMKEKENE